VLWPLEQIEFFSFRQMVLEARHVLHNALRVGGMAVYQIGSDVLRVEYLLLHTRVILALVKIGLVHTRWLSSHLLLVRRFKLLPLDRCIV
jgi:hypothetical protein